MPRARDTRLRRGLNLRSIRPEVISELKAQATALGVTPSEYVRRLVMLHAEAQARGFDALSLHVHGLLPKVQL